MKPTRTTLFASFLAAYFLSQFFRSTNAVIAPNLAHEFALDASRLGAFREWYPGREYPAVSGVFVGVGALGALAAATPLAALIGWRPVFAAAAAITVLAAVSIVVIARDAPEGTAARGEAHPHLSPTQQRGGLRSICSSPTPA